MSTPLTTELIANLRKLFEHSSQGIDEWSQVDADVVSALDELVVLRQDNERARYERARYERVRRGTLAELEKLRAALGELVRTDDMFYAGLLTKNWSKGKGYSEYLIARKAAWAAARAAIEGRDAVQTGLLSPMLNEGRAVNKESWTAMYLARCEEMGVTFENALHLVHSSHDYSADPGCQAETDWKIYLAENKAS